MSEPEKAQVLARGFFHALPEEDDYEFHDEKYMTGTCDGCVPAAIVPVDALSAVTAERDAHWELLQQVTAFGARAGAERDQLRAEVERLTGIVGNQVVRKLVGQGDQREVDELVSLGIEQDKRELEKLRTEVEALRQDAGRYRWILMQPDAWFVLGDAYGLTSEHDGVVDLSASIDAAMAAKEANP